MEDRETLNTIFAIMRNLLIVPMDGLNPIPRKGTTKRECYRALWEIQELLGTRRMGCMHVAQTNADRIRTMSDEELANVFLCGCDGRKCPPRNYYSEIFPGDEALEQCKDCWLDWLKQEAQNEN